VSSPGGGVFESCGNVVELGSAKAAGLTAAGAGVVVAAVAADGAGGAGAGGGGAVAGAGGAGAGAGGAGAGAGGAGAGACPPALVCAFKARQTLNPRTRINLFIFMVRAFTA